MKLLGIDYGRRRIGVAVCGPLKIATPVATIVYKSEKLMLEELQRLVSHHEAETIVLGQPLNMDNSRGEMVKEVEKFATMLRRHLQIPVELWDERLTTYQAENSLRQIGLSPKQRQKNRDQVAACLLLQNYVDCRG